MEVDIVNDTTLPAYLIFGASTLVGTFNNGTSAVALDQTTSYTIAAGGTLTGISLQTIVSGNLEFSLGNTLSTSTGTAFQAPGTVGDSAVRWDTVEMTYFNNPTSVSVADLTSTSFFGLELQVQTFVTGTSAAQATLGWNQPYEQVLAELANTATSDATATPLAVVTGPNGVNIPGLGDVLRVIAPSTVPPAGQAAFAQPTAYIDFVQNGTFQNTASAVTVGVTTDVVGTFDGSTVGTVVNQPANYDFTATIPTVAGNGAQPGDLLLLGTIDIINNGTTLPPGPLQTIDIRAADLANAIIGADPTFYVNGSAENFGFNDVYAAAVRDILGGFDLGFVGSTTKDALTGLELGAETTNNWYVVQNGTAANAANAFAAAQPTNPTFYDQYAAAVAAAGDSYGFPFSDLFPGPQVSLDNTDTTVITILPSNTPCFAAGTLIRTSAGEVPVEHLTAGMTLPTAVGGRDGELVWLGHRTVDCRRHPRPESVLPIRISRDAFGPGQPHCDLLLSPDHALLFDGVLIPVRCLVNDVNIVRDTADMVTYYHVELDRHDVIWAAGLAVESFLDTGNRSAFANGGQVVTAHPDFNSRVWEAAGCAPLVIVGQQVEQARAMLRARADVRRPHVAREGGSRVAFA